VFLEALHAAHTTHGQRSSSMFLVGSGVLCLSCRAQPARGHHHGDPEEGEGSDEPGGRDLLQVLPPDGRSAHGQRCGGDR